MERQIDALDKEKSDLEAQIPANWPDSHKHYLELADAEKKARNAYRHNVDNAYEPINELRKMIANAGDLAAVRKDLEALRPIIASQPADQVSDAIKAVQEKLRAIPETSAINSSLTKARRLFRKDDPNRDDAANFIDDSIKKLAPEAEWRVQAAERLGPALNAYNAVISDTIGLRQQERLTSDQATDVAGCLSYHRDISLDF